MYVNYLTIWYPYCNKFSIQKKKKKNVDVVTYKHYDIFKVVKDIDISLIKITRTLEKN